MAPTHTDDLEPDASRHGARAALYAGLAPAFCYPEAGTIEELTDPAVVDGLRRAGDVLDLRDEVEALLDALSAADLDSLADTHTELFGLPDEGTYPVVPYEAAYTTPDEIGLEQRRIATVVGLLGAFDLEPGSEFDERPDHVAVELELMQVLAASRGVAASRGEVDRAETIERAEATVLDEHLIGFVPAFAHDLREATDDETFRAAARLAEALVREDHRAHEPIESSPPGVEPPTAGRQPPGAGGRPPNPGGGGR